MSVEEQLDAYARATEQAATMSRVSLASPDSESSHKGRGWFVGAAAAVLVGALVTLGVLASSADRDAQQVRAAASPAPVQVTAPPGSELRRQDLAGGLVYVEPPGLVIESRDPSRGIGGEQYDTIVVTSPEQPDALMYLHVISGLDLAAPPDGSVITLDNGTEVSVERIESGPDVNRDAVSLTWELDDGRHAQAAMNGGDESLAVEWLNRLQVEART